MGLCLCTHIMEDDGQLSRNQHLQRDMTVVKNRIQARKLPVVWMNNDGDSKKIEPDSPTNSHACNIAERFGYACISLDKILKEESEKGSNRGKLIKQRVTQRRKIPDRLVINLLKEKIIEAGDTRGYIINGFPRNAKQSNLFVKEIANVDCIILLEGHAELADALHPGATNIGSEDGSIPVAADNTTTVEKATNSTTKDVKEKKDEVSSTATATAAAATTSPTTATGEEPSGDKRSQDTMKYEDLFANGILKYDLLIEKNKPSKPLPAKTTLIINTNEPQADVFLKIEAAILDRLSISNM